MTCPVCGHDPKAKILATWRFAVARKPPSLNDRIVNSGFTARKYREERQAWGWEFRAARLDQRIALANTRRRRLSIARVFAGRERAWDPDNFIGGAKLIVDALVLEGLLLDDDRQHTEIQYIQKPGPDSRVEFVIQELA